MNKNFNDKAIWDLIGKEAKRQTDHIELIASENYVSKEVLEATGTILTNKYAEGYPGKRYYGGCEIIDEIETIAIERAKKLFNCNFANVQAHSGSSANMAAYLAVLKPGDKVLAMSLDAGGHLTHGHKINFSGISYTFKNYTVDKKTELIDMNEVAKMAEEFQPKLIIAGASNYSRFIDFEGFSKIAKKVGALFLVDMAHISGLVATGLHPSPFPWADIVTSTTHKTLRGPRGAIILSNDEKIAQQIDRAIFPGSQGGPLEHVIAARAIAFLEALQPSFKQYSQDVIDNCKHFAKSFKNGRIVTGGTDNHLFTIDVKKSYGVTGDIAEKLLLKINIVCNKNTIPFDLERPTVTSGIRLGTAAMTSRGFKKAEFEQVANMIESVLKDSSEQNLKANLMQAEKLAKAFPTKDVY